jgi:hypothetical protein
MNCNATKTKTDNLKTLDQAVGCTLCWAALSRAQTHLFQSPSWVLLGSAPSLPLVKITITIAITQ